MGSRSISNAPQNRTRLDSYSSISKTTLEHPLLPAHTPEPAGRKRTSPGLSISESDSGHRPLLPRKRKKSPAYTHPSLRSFSPIAEEERPSFGNICSHAWTVAKWDYQTVCQNGDNAFVAFFRVWIKNFLSYLKDFPVEQLVARKVQSEFLKKEKYKEEDLANELNAIREFTYMYPGVKELGTVGFNTRYRKYKETRDSDVIRRDKIDAVLDFTEKRIGLLSAELEILKNKSSQFSKEIILINNEMEKLKKSTDEAYLIISKALATKKIRLKSIKSVYREKIEEKKYRAKELKKGRDKIRNEHGINKRKKSKKEISNRYLNAKEISFSLSQSPFSKGSSESERIDTETAKPPSSDSGKSHKKKLPRKFQNQIDLMRAEHQGLLEEIDRLEQKEKKEIKEAEDFFRGKKIKFQKSMSILKECRLKLERSLSKIDNSSKTLVLNVEEIKSKLSNCIQELSNSLSEEQTKEISDYYSPLMEGMPPMEGKPTPKYIQTGLLREMKKIKEINFENWNDGEIQERFSLAIENVCNAIKASRSKLREGIKVQEPFRRPEVLVKVPELEKPSDTLSKDEDHLLTSIQLADMKEETEETNDRLVEARVSLNPKNPQVYIKPVELVVFSEAKEVSEEKEVSPSLERKEDSEEKEGSPSLGKIDKKSEISSLLNIAKKKEKYSSISIMPNINKFYQKEEDKNIFSDFFSWVFESTLLKNLKEEFFKDFFCDILYEKSLGHEKFSEEFCKKYKEYGYALDEFKRLAQDKKSLGGLKLDLQENGVINTKPKAFTNLFGNSNYDAAEYIKSNIPKTSHKEFVEVLEALKMFFSA